jgi:hypothetical protein
LITVTWGGADEVERRLAALGFALSCPEADALIAAARPPPDLDWDDTAMDDPAGLDPARWPAA